MGRHSMIDKEYIVELWNAGFTAKEIAKRTGYAENTVYAVRYQKIGRIRPKNWSYTRTRVKELCDEGMTQVEIANALGISRQRVNQITTQEGLEPKKYSNRIEKEKIENFVTDYQNGRDISEIKKEYKISGTTLYNHLEKNNVKKRGAEVSPKALAVCVYKTNGEKVGEYKSITEACAELGFANGIGNVARYLRQGKQYLYGYKWEYKSK